MLAHKCMTFQVTSRILIIIINFFSDDDYIFTREVTFSLWNKHNWSVTEIHIQSWQTQTLEEYVISPVISESAPLLDVRQLARETRQWADCLLGMSQRHHSEVRLQTRKYDCSRARGNVSPTCNECSWDCNNLVSVAIHGRTMSRKRAFILASETVWLAFDDSRKHKHFTPAAGIATHKEACMNEWQEQNRNNSETITQRHDTSKQRVILYSYAFLGIILPFIFT